MRDIDYDELDKAMDQLINTNSTDELASAGDSKPTQIKQPEPVVSPVSEHNLETAPAKPQPQISSRPIPSLASRRGGKFMDVVSHQSTVRPVSAVRPVAHAKPTQAKPSVPPRDINKPNGPLISSFVSRAPKNKPVVKTTTAIQPPEPEESLEPPKPELSLSTSDNVRDNTHVDHNATVVPTPFPAATQKPDDDDLDIDRITEDLNKSLGFDSKDAPVEKEKEPVESPFLPDTKVEKRPLGAFSAPTIAPVVAPVSDDKADEAKTTEVQPRFDSKTESEDVAKLTKSPLPAELGSDLLSIESDSVAHDNDDKNDEPKTATEKPVELSSQSNSSDGSNDTPHNSLSQPESATPPSSVPIAPVIADANSQHKNSAKKDQSAAIYDNANTVNKALLQKSPKQKGGVLKVVLWIFILVVLGVGAGAAVYFLLLPNL